MNDIKMFSIFERLGFFITLPWFFGFFGQIVFSHKDGTWWSFFVGFLLGLFVLLNGRWPRLWPVKNNSFIYFNREDQGTMDVSPENPILVGREKKKGYISTPIEGFENSFKKCSMGCPKLTFSFNLESSAGEDVHLQGICLNNSFDYCPKCSAKMVESRSNGGGTQWKTVKKSQPKT